MEKAHIISGTFPARTERYVALPVHLKQHTQLGAAQHANLGHLQNGFRHETNQFDDNLSSSYNPLSPASNMASAKPTGDATARKMRSADNLQTPRTARPAEYSQTMPVFAEEGKHDKAKLQEWFAKGEMVLDESSSKWIHRDKLARIETEELHAAGFVVPKTRSASRLRRERSDIRLETDSRRSRQTSGFETPKLSAAPSWDLRTPEEIAESEASAYFISTGAGGTRIPLAKSSPVPLSLDVLENGSSAIRRFDSMDSDMLAYAKTRSRSASTSFRDGDSPYAGKRSVTDTSPQKRGAGVRKTSISSNRPTTRNGPGAKESPGTRPSTRNGRKPRVRAPEGEPPWMANTYKPDPRLPPDQQFPAEVSKRLAQQQMEQEGAYGDAYDKDFRPLNRNSLLKTSEGDDPKGWEAWPLKPAVTTAPLQRQGSSYSTMPKISDKAATSPIPSPRPNMTPQMQSMPQMGTQPGMQQLEVAQEPEDKKGGCGCCVVM